MTTGHNNNDDNQNRILYSDEVNEVLTKVPNWLVRSGVTLLAIVFILFVMVAWIVRYPDIIKAEIKISTQAPPAYISAPVTGKIERLMVQNNSMVKHGQPLMVIENPAVYSEIQYVKNQIYNFDKTVNEVYSTFSNKRLNLGEIQKSFNVFYEVVSKYNSYLKLNRIPSQINDLHITRQARQALLEQQKRKVAMQEREMELINLQYKRDSLLYADNVISASQWEKSQQLSYAQRVSLETGKAQLKSTNIAISELNAEINLLRLLHDENLLSHKNQMYNARQELLADIAIWERKYVVKSNESGLASFAIFLEENMNVSSNQQLMSVIPKGTEHLIGKMNIGFTGAGKIKPGQKVNIKLNDFPYLEYGIIEGEVSTLSQVAGEKYYMGTVSLPKGLTTNNGFEIPYKQDMSGTVEIITENMRFLSRLIKPLRTVQQIQKGYRELGGEDQ